MIYPFTSNEGILLRDTYSLDLSLVEKINTTLSSKEQKEFISLYITEGIPFAFKLNPLIFEDIRNWLGKHLNVEAKCITITGSSRVGFSLNPQKWGKPYQCSADLDFIIVSKKIFEDYKHEFKEFASDIQIRIKTKKRVSDFDIKNIETITNTLMNSKFIDQSKMPINIKYKNIYKAYDLLAHLLKRMKLTANCPNPHNASIRVYEDWQSCIEQLNKNLKYGFKFRIK